MIAMDDGVLMYREERPSLWLRIFIVALGIALTIGIPVPFVIHADWTTFSPMLLLAMLFIVLPAALGCFFVFIGLVSATDLRMDTHSGFAERHLVGPVINRKDRFPLSQIKPPEVFLHGSAEEDPTPVLRLRLPRGRVDMACFRDLADARAWAEQINRILRG
ncbi:hypothetical protein [Bosea sp. (in: a-proteobacteria)]|uniref:hypothetical protein n=1 Tax=Bosea sp. (in: a-proteobacteria) TaxID=1871050 RepID=UPI0026029A0C|nr:hypothetical protein [Bosea sp. (in: a-proteobacteria)]MCO5091243.1 hypothetical protein [Bosea sp. (in: a-proteobacteria)]